MLGFPVGFTAPLVLAALAVLPAIWLMLRVTPPQPKRIDFPPLRILTDLLPRQENPARTPPWLLLLRMLAAACLIVAAAGPVWNPAASGSGGPLLLVLDNGFPAAHDWRERSAFAVERLEAAVRTGRPVAVLATADKPGALDATAPGAALERVRSVGPQPWLVARGAHAPGIAAFLARDPGAEVVWVADGTAGPDDEPFRAALGAANVSVVQPPRAGALAIAGAENAAGRLTVTVVRPEPNGREGGTLRAVDGRGLPVADAPFGFAADATVAEAGFDLPMEVRNAISRIDVVGEGSAGAVSLLDARGRRRRVGLVSGASADQSQPLLAPTYYLARALGPYADVREAHGGVADAIAQLLDQQVTVLALADVGTLDRESLGRVTTFVEKGGLLLRFAGSRLAAGNDDLVPVKLRRGGRNLGGALSWDAPRTLSPFGRESPFFGLAVPRDLGVRRQILAEPDGDLGRRTWAALEDGTPIVTADRRGQGMIVLLHVTADAAWSNLPLSGLFVDMLRRVVSLSGLSAPATDGTGQTVTVAPTRVLDGHGAFVPPPATALPVPRSFAERASAQHPPGFYGPGETGLSVNALLPGDRLARLDLGPFAARVAPLAAAATLDLAGPLLTAVLLLLILDGIASLLLGGHLSRLRPGRRAGSAAAALALLMLVGAFPPRPALAQAPAPRPSPELALVTRLAFAITGDAQVDATSRAGLTGLTQMLASRTALEPGDPVAVDLARDELSFFPILYVPFASGQPPPSEAAIRRLDTFMKNGGTVIFDTRDALNARPGGAPTPETTALRRTLATLDVPELEPVPRDHVLTKTFYLVDRFPGRYATGQTWVEALPPSTDGERRPARAGDGVSPVVITSNDLAAAWAVGRSGEPLYPVVGSDPRQREMAFRGGINLVMYTLTGNYKADQVHVPALLERLGQ